ncbi:MAG: putative Zn-dependent protease [Bacillariaceae sp.]|jgi:predicted Zn-dependent protease
MAHNLARHQGEKMSGNALVSIVALMSLLVDPSGSVYTIFMPAAKILGELPHSRELELEADGIGMRLAAEACYDPEALSHVFRRMDHASKEGSDNNLTIKPPEFLSTHPSDESRIKDMQKWLPEDKRIFNMYEGERCRELRRQINATNRPLQSSSRENNWR